MRKKIKFSGARKIKVIKTNPNKTDTRTGYYLEFFFKKKTSSQLDRFQELKGLYLVMNNAPIHTHEGIDNLITYRGYKCIYLPSHSPGINLIE